MIISASRRTDIPRYFGEWFMNRIRAGFCDVQNPYNRNQYSRVSLLPDDVDAIVFWTRNGAPFIRNLPELDERGFPYYFLHTLVHYPPPIETAAISLEQKISDFCSLSKVVGPEKVVWRYDPIVISNATGIEYHLKKFKEIAELIEGFTRRAIISFLDLYGKVERRLEAAGVTLSQVDICDISDMMEGIKATAEAAGIEIQSCAEKADLSVWNIRRGKCIDERLLSSLFGLSLSSRKDPGQRKLCRCIPSKDIGAYNTCPGGCIYCYASNSADTGNISMAGHDSTGTNL